MPAPRQFRVLAASVLLGALAACSSKPPRSPVIAEAFAGPATLNLHQEIDAKSATVTTVRHGDKLEIISQRRRWYKVRTAKGIEGWTSDRELLDPAQMKRLAALAAQTAGQPSQGVASTFGTVNVHTEPSRQSPSFVQIREHEKVDVIAHRVTPRAAGQKHELIPPRPKLEKKKGKGKEKENAKASKIPPPPAPAPPLPPADWIELSGDPKPQPAPAPETAPRGPVDDWTLVRTESGQTGWVLTSSLYLAIPDEVAQYAEGHRITSYFSLGKIADAGQQKDIWLWTTSVSLGEDHDFDGYRVFVWSLKHHRYETAYIQRRERGFFPVLAKTGEFSVCLERDDGSRTRKLYTMEGNSVRPAGDRPCDASGPDDDEESTASAPAKAETNPRGIADRVKDKAKSLFGK